MKRILLAGVLAMHAAAAAAGDAPKVPPALERSCRDAIAAAAARHGVPPKLLEAIGEVESSLHPFALNIGGRAIFPASYPEAQAIAAKAIAAGRSVDIGCLQINVSKYHRHAFPTLLHALHPDWNAEYGAGYMSRLFEKHGSWESAAANYHSSRPAAQVRYVTEVGRRIRSPKAPPAAAARPVETVRREPGDLRSLRVAEAARAPVVLRSEIP